MCLNDNKLILNDDDTCCDSCFEGFEKTRSEMVHRDREFEADESLRS